MLGRVSDEIPASDTIAGIVGQGEEGGRIFSLLVWGAVAVICIGFTATLILPRIFPPTLQVRAAKLLMLPADATVVSVIDSNPPYGRVSFRLPEKSPTGSRADEVWKQNGWPRAFGGTVGISAHPPLGKRHGSKTPFLRTGKGSPAVSVSGHPTYSFREDSDMKISLIFDARTNTYRFEKSR